jgi:hypothetical protein
MHETFTPSSRRSAQPILRALRPLAARILLPAIALQLVLPVAARAAADSDSAVAPLLATSTDGDAALEPGDPGATRNRLSPIGPNSNRNRLSPIGPNSNRSRLSPIGPNSNRNRLSPIGPNSNRSRLGDQRPGPDDRTTPEGDRAAARDFEWVAPNGLVARISSYPDGRGNYASSASLTSPDGESMTLDFLPASEGGPVALIDGAILVSYTVTDDGRVSSVLVDNGDRAVKSARHRKPSRADDSAYALLIESLGEHHSARFLAQSGQALNDLERQGIAPATLRFIIECSLGVAGYIASIGGLVTGCTAAGVVTFGASCAIAILAHELAVASGVMACAK